MQTPILPLTAPYFAGLVYHAFDRARNVQPAREVGPERYRQAACSCFVRADRNAMVLRLRLSVARYIQARTRRVAAGESPGSIRGGFRSVSLRRRTWSLTHTKNMGWRAFLRMSMIRPGWSSR
jgi:hypothetical protein